MRPETWRSANPDLFFLDGDEPEALAAYLVRRGVIEPDEELSSVTKAGDGNMNCAVRVVTGRQRFIVKQSRPWVEKYPQFAAPGDRALREMEFYQVTSQSGRLARAMPGLRDADADARLIILEDLGSGADYTDLHGGATFAESDVDALADYPSELHGTRFVLPPGHGLANREMRSLNSQHIFRIPLDTENGLDLDHVIPGLHRVAEVWKRDRTYVTRVHQLESVYLADGPCLLHGDFFPGSFLRTDSGPKVIDPEFCYLGRPEFDGAVLIAHLLLAGQDPAIVQRFRDRYRRPGNHRESVMLQLAGVEIMRRLIGYAQLPLKHGLDRRSELLELSGLLVGDPERALNA